MANNDNYATWLIYLLVFNLLSSIVLASIFGAIGFANSISPISQPKDGGGAGLDYTGGLTERVDFSFWSTFLGGLVFVPLELWEYSFPIGAMIVLFFLFVKMAIAICAYKVINPVSSG